MKRYIVLLFTFLCIECVSFSDTIVLKEEMAIPTLQPMEKIFILFQGAKSLDYYFRAVSNKLSSDLRDNGVNSQVFFKGMNAYGKNSLEDENKLLKEQINSYQPTHILHIKQSRNDRIVSQGGYPNVLPQKTYINEFDIYVDAYSKNKQALWAGNLRVAFTRTIDNELRFSSVGKTTTKIMNAFTKNGYLQK